MSDTSLDIKESGLIKYKTIRYRNYEIALFSDLMGNHYYAKSAFDNLIVDLGLNNCHAEKDMCAYLDRKLDLVTTFEDDPEFSGAKLTYFNNGGYRDLALYYKGRLLKVILASGAVNEEAIIKAAKKLLVDSGLLSTE